MVKRFRCTTHYAGDGSDVVTMISCTMIDEPDEDNGQVMDEPKPPLQLEVEAAVGRYNLAYPEDRVRAVRAACKLIAAIDDDPIRYRWVQYVSRLTGVDVFTVNKLTKQSAPETLN